MALINTTPSRLGQANATGDQNTLFLKVFSGEILTVFEETNVMLPTTTVRTISSGKSAQFPATGTATASYHTPGHDILTEGSGSASDYLSKIKHNEIVVTINNLLLSSVFIDSLDEAKNHYDIRSEYTKQMARALAAEADKMLIVHGLVGARVTGSNDRFGGTDFLGNTFDLDVASLADVTSAKLIDGIFDAAQHMDSKNVPSEDRYCVIGPDAYYKLIATDGSAGGLVINRDFGNEGNGSIAGGTVYSVGGFKILKSNNVPVDNVDMTAAAKAGDLSTLSGVIDFADTNAKHPVALCFHKSGLGTVKLKDLKVEADYQIQRQGSLVVASYAMGHEALRNEALVELAY